MARIGRNAPCPCGSGRKYKHCCLNAAQRLPLRQRLMIGTVGVLLALGVIAMAVAVVERSGHSAPKGQRVWSEEHQHWHEG